MLFLIGFIEISLLKEELLKNELIKYIDRGNQLRIDFHYISDNIHNEVIKVAETPRLFYFIVASTGMGKSHLALSLSMPVIYIPLTTNQAIYECLSAVFQAAQEALAYDYNGSCGDFDMQSVRRAFLGILMLSFLRLAYI